MKKSNYYFLYRLIKNDSDYNNHYEYYVVKSDTTFKRFKEDFLYNPDILDYNRIVFLNLKDFDSELPYMKVSIENDMQTLCVYFNDLLVLSKGYNSDSIDYSIIKNPNPIIQIMNHMQSFN